MKSNWQTKKLGEISNIEIGKTPSRSNKKFWDKEKETKNIWLSIRDLSNIKGKMISDSKEYISDNGTKISKITPKGTLLVSFKLTLGKLAFAGCDLYTNEAIASIHIKNSQEIYKEYLYYYLNYFDWDNEAMGDIKVKGKTLNKAKLKKIEINFPPLVEQKRIVKILNETFEKLEKVKENTEKNLQNSIELFESNLNNIFINPKKNWEEKSLKDICDVIAGQSPEGKYYNKLGKGLPFYQGKKEFTEKYINRPTVWTSVVTKEAEKDDILMSVRAPVGPINFSTQKICIGRGLAAIRSGNDIDKNFLYYFLKFNENNLVSNKGAVFDSINKTQIENIKINLPDTIKEQKEVVEKLDKLSSKTKRLEEIYKNKLENIEELNKSVLQKAFTGKI